MRSTELDALEMVLQPEMEEVAKYSTSMTHRSDSDSESETRTEIAPVTVPVALLRLQVTWTEPSP